MGLGVMRLAKNNSYIITHTGAKRYTCKTAKNKDGETVYLIAKKRGGNYESMVSFKDLPKFNILKDKGRSWPYTKNYKPVMDRIVLDIDCPDGLDTAFEVTKKIMQETEEYKEYANIYFSGSKGFHIEWITAELDIIDTNTERPMYACPLYRNFLNYFNNKYPEVDLNIKDIGTRIFRKHRTKHEKTGKL